MSRREIREIESRLRDAFAEKANSVQTPADAWDKFQTGPEHVAPGRNRTRIYGGLAVAAVLATAAAVGAFAVLGSSDSKLVVNMPPASEGPSMPSSAATGASTPSTVPARCDALTGADLAEKQSQGSAANQTSVRRLQVQASDCSDAIVFNVDSIPILTVGYQSGPFTADGSGQTASVEGNAFLVIRFDSAVTDDRAAPQATDIRTARPSAVREMREISGLDGKLSWVVGLDDERPFRITPSIASLAIELETVGGEQVPVACENPTDHFQVQIPAGWLTEMSQDAGPCKYFSATPFTLFDGPLDLYLPHVMLSPEPFSEPTTTLGKNQTVIAEDDMEIDGRAARVTQIEANGAGAFAKDRFSLYEYAIDWGPRGTLTVSVLGPSHDYDSNKAAVDALAMSARYAG